MLFAFLCLYVIAWSVNVLLSALSAPCNDILVALATHKLSVVSIDVKDVFPKIVSLFICGYFFVIVFSVISAILSASMYEISARYFKYAERPITNICCKSISWNLFRGYYVLSPVLKVSAIIIMFNLLCLLFFNQILVMAGLFLEFTVFLFAFLGFILFFSFLVASLMSVWNFAVSFFGMECAVSEPHLDNNQIVRRSRHLIFNKSMNVGLYLLYGFLTVLLIAEIVILKVNFDKVASNYYYLSALLGLNLALYFFMSYFKTALYIDSLLNRYTEITSKNSLSFWEKYANVVLFGKKTYNLFIKYLNEFEEFIGSLKRYGAGVRKFGR